MVLTVKAMPGEEADEGDDERGAGADEVERAQELGGR